MNKSDYKCSAKSCSLPLYSEGALTRGLCPACHLFGTAEYRGRVRFGIGNLCGDANTEWFNPPHLAALRSCCLFTMASQPDTLFSMRRYDFIDLAKKIAGSHILKTGYLF